MEHDDLLLAFVDAALGADAAALTQARGAAVASLGEAGMVDAAAVIATFAMQVRVADATGIPLDTPIELATRSLREELGVEKFSASSQTPRGGWGRGLLARVVEPLAPIALKLAARKQSRK